AGDSFVAPPAKRFRRRPRIHEPFVAVPLQRLLDRSWDDCFPARTRLLLYLEYETKYGQQEVSLTNAVAADLGLNRQNKMRELRRLERRGRILLTTKGRSAVSVTFLPNTPTDQV